MTEQNFFGQMDLWTNIAWIVIFLFIVAILWLLHHKEKKRLEKKAKH